MKATIIVSVSCVSEQDAVSLCEDIREFVYKFVPVTVVSSSFMTYDFVPVTVTWSGGLWGSQLIV